MPRSSDLDLVAPDDQVVTQDNHPKTKESSEMASSLGDSIPENQPSSEKVDTQMDQKNSQKKHKTEHHYRDKIYEILGHTKSPLSSFLVRPDVFSFEEKDEDEEIILVLRQHWFVNVSWILTTIIMAIFPVVINSFGLLDGFPGVYKTVAILFLYLITFAYAFEKFLSWYFNVYIITDERVIDIDFNNLLNKKFSEAKISMIQDVTSKVVGLAQTMFNFGSVQIQTASEIPEICFERVPNPEKIIKVLQNFRQEEELEALQGRIN